MSMATCTKCGDVFDSDFQLESDENGDCCCDACYEEMMCPECGELPKYVADGPDDVRKTCVNKQCENFML